MGEVVIIFLLLLLNFLVLLSISPIDDDVLPQSVKIVELRYKDESKFTQFLQV